MFKFLKTNLKYVIMVVALVIIFIMSRFSGDYFGDETVAFNENFSSYPLLIIDSGHGGLDGGAVSENGYNESKATLEIGKKAKDICDFLGLPNIMTRYDDQSLDFDETKGARENKVSDTRARVELVNSYEDSFLVSVHLNKFTEEKYSGAQVFYNNDESQKFANILQSNIKKTLDQSNERKALKSPQNIYLIEKSNCSSIIFECGFLSNKKESELLACNDYQTKLALNMVSSYLEYLKEV